MIISRAPLRISIGGGGTDLPSYFENNNGTTFTSMAINKYIYVSINKKFDQEYFIRYKENESINQINEINHPIIRETLLRFKPEIEPIEITSTSDIPSGTGLGSSGTFGVALQLALRKYKNEKYNPLLLATESTVVEKDILNRPIGLQDQFISAYGGFTSFNVSREGNVDHLKHKISSDLKKCIKDNLLLYYMDVSRDSKKILGEEKKQMANKEYASHYMDIVERGINITNALQSCDIEIVGNLMHEYWMIKRERQEKSTDKRVNEIYDYAYSNKLITGGKLVGAGGSGFLLFCTLKPNDLRKRMQEIGVRELEFNIDEDGAKIIE